MVSFEHIYIRTYNICVFYMPYYISYNEFYEAFRNYQVGIICIICIGVVSVDYCYNCV
jgi:hypothetical protein